MSMPSSRLLVATTAGRSPALSASSMCLRSSRETEPWWARATTGAAPAAIPDSAMISAGVRPPAACAAAMRSIPVGALGGQLVEARAEAFGAAPSIDEHDRRPVRLDQVEDPLLDRGPDRGPAGAGVVIVGADLVEPRHVLDRDLDADLDRLRGGRRNHGDRMRTAEEAGGLLDGPHGRGQADALRRLGQQCVETLQ